MELEEHRCRWTCGCGNRLTIRSVERRKTGPHNFRTEKKASDLNWNGLAEERGWKTITVEDATIVICPRCVTKARRL